MSAPADPLRQVQADLAAWHATHPDATFAELEAAVEDQLARVRAHLLAERSGPRAGETAPACRVCGTTMLPRTRAKRTLTLRGDAALELERDYLVCPSCEEGFFPPG